MIPNTVLGLVVIAAALGPGYVFIRIEERRRPRIQRSGLLETAELVVIGGSSSTAAFAVVTAVAAQLGWLNESKLAREKSAYLLAHLSRFTVIVLVTLAFSYGLTWVAGRVIFRRRPATIKPVSAWDEVLEPKVGILNYVTVGLDDGLAVAGDVVGHTVGDRPSDERELIIGNPEIRAPGTASFERVRDHRVVLRGDRIRTVSVIYYEGVLPKSERPGEGREVVKRRVGLSQLRTRRPRGKAG